MRKITHEELDIMDALYDADLPRAGELLLQHAWSGRRALHPNVALRIASLFAFTPQGRGRPTANQTRRWVKGMKARDKLTELKGKGLSADDAMNETAKELGASTRNVERLLSETRWLENELAKRGRTLV